MSCDDALKIYPFCVVSCARMRICDAWTKMSVCPPGILTCFPVWMELKSWANRQHWNWTLTFCCETAGKEYFPCEKNANVHVNHCQ